MSELKDNGASRYVHLKKKELQELRQDIFGSDLYLRMSRAYHHSEYGAGTHEEAEDMRIDRCTAEAELYARELLAASKARIAELETVARPIAEWLIHLSTESGYEGMGTLEMGEELLAALNPNTKG